MPWRTEAARARFAAQNLDVEFFEGVHGATAGIAATVAHCDSPGHYINAGKLAITVSKLLLWSACLERGYDEVLLLENDAVPCADFANRFDAAYRALPGDWQVVHVGHCCAGDKPARRVSPHASEIRYPQCCHAVLWKRAAMALAVAEFKTASWGSPSDIVLAKLVYPKLRHYTLTPALVESDRTLSEAASTGRWSDLDGWFEFQRIYDDALDAVEGHQVFVEVGCWHGRSTAYMAEEIKRRMAPVEFYAVDTWKGSEENGLAELVRRHHGGDLFPRFLENMSRVGVYDYVRPLRMTSTEGATRFANGSVDFVFLDADHEYESVRADIAAWRPKLRKGGTLAGHDIDRPGVRRAVEEAFGGDWRVWERNWIVDSV